MARRQIQHLAATQSTTSFPQQQQETSTTAATTPHIDHHQEVISAPNTNYDISTNSTMDYGQHNSRPFNRGNKLKQTERESFNINPDKPSLWAASRISESLKFTRSEQKRVINSKSYRQRIAKTMLEKESPYYGINIEDYWSLLDNPDQIKNIPAFLDILKSKDLVKLAETTMGLITREKQRNQLLTRLNDVLFQDNPRYDDLELDKSLPSELLDELVDLNSSHLSCSTEFINRLTLIRDHLADAFRKKKLLRAKLLNLSDIDEEGYQPQSNHFSSSSSSTAGNGVGASTTAYNQSSSSNAHVANGTTNISSRSNHQHERENDQDEEQNQSSSRKEKESSKGKSKSRSSK